MKIYKAIGVIAAILSLSLILGITWLRTSLPQTSGTVFVTGITKETTIRRDRLGIPHIAGSTEADAYFGLGYAHAQDRLWQMEISRRAGAGRLSEIFGKRTLPADKYLRGLGIYNSAEASLSHLSEHAKSLIQSYSAGINGYLLSHKGALPLEFVIFNHRPENWTAADSMACAKMMAHQLGGNAGDELLRHQLLEILNHEQIDELWGVQRPTIRRKTNNPTNFTTYLHDYLIPSNRRMVGSNNWVVSGKHTLSKKPMLASDPHLGLTAPSPWYLTHITAPNFNVAGGTLPGIPVIIIGRNQDIAWGVTNTGPDVQDLFIEKISLLDPNSYLTPEGESKFAIRKEIIRIKDEDDVEFTVRETRHGPVISDFATKYGKLAESDEIVAFSWTALTSNDTTLQAGFNIANAGSWREFTAALQDFIAPQQSFVMAAVNGDVGFFAPGNIPIRRSGNGWLPTAGWTGAGDWIGQIPYQELPSILNPDEGIIVTANQDITGTEYPYFISQDWAARYRFLRITDLLSNPLNHSIKGFKQIQTDVVSLMASDFKEWILSSGMQPELQERFQNWDGSMKGDMIEPLIFHAWYRELTKLLYSDELGNSFEQAWERRPKFLTQALKYNAVWCDNVTTEAPEDCNQIVGKARENAITWLTQKYGTHRENWKWGRAHIARHKHAAFSGIPVLGKLFDITHPHDGGPYTVMQANTTLRNEKVPFEENHGAALRAIFDLSDLDNTHLMISTGQSGNRLSKHYSSLSGLWRKGKYIKLPMSLEGVRDATHERLTLLPDP